jgi:hypothetical protein
MIEQGHFNPRQGVSLPEYDSVNQHTRKYIEAQKLMDTRRDLFSRKLYEEMPDNRSREPGAFSPVETVAWLLRQSMA